MVRVESRVVWKKRLYRGLVALFTCGILAVAWLLFVFLPNPHRTSDEQYGVYSAYIEDGLTGDSHSLGDRRGIVIIAADATMGAGVNMVQRLRFSVFAFHNLRKRTNPPRPMLICRFLWINLRRHRFDRHFSISSDYELLDPLALSLETFHERFPHSYGYMTFSSVAFSNDGATALFYTEHLCGLCGGGKYVVMQKSRDKWTVVNRYSTWVS